MKNKLLILPLGVLAVFVFVRFVCKPGAGNSEYSTTLAVRRTLNSTILATGTIRPKVGAEVKVGSRISGLLKHLHVTVGTQVQSGQVIAELDRTELLARKRLAEADLLEAEAVMGYAERTLARVDSLKQRNLVSDEAFEQAKNDFRIAQARQQRAAANLALVEVQLSYTVIRAPISGTIASVSTQEGEVIAAGFSAPTFVTVVDLDRLEVVAFVDEVDIGRVRLGQNATFVVDSYPNRDFQGVVRSVAPKAVILANVVNYAVSMDITSSGGLLKPDMTANITIVTDKREMLVVRNEAIRRRNGQKFVALMENGRPVFREISAGWRDERYTEVITGLKEGEQVVLGELDEKIE